MHVLLLQSSVRLDDAALFAASMAWMQQGVAACISKDIACRFRVLEAHRATRENHLFAAIGEQLDSEDTCDMVSTCMEYSVLSNAFTVLAKLEGGVFLFDLVSISRLPILPLRFVGSRSRGPTAIC